jgi:regulatory protein
MKSGTITALRAQAKDPKRVNVFVNGEFAIGVSLATISRAGLYVGKQLSAEEYARLEQFESGDKAYLAALRFLNARPRSSAELRERLARKEFAPEAIDAALARLGELGLVDDRAFARFWVENRQVFRPRGAGALRDELRRKGVASGTIADVLSDAELAGDEAEKAMVLARAALRKYADSADRQSFARRMGGYLQRRGFGFEVIRPIVDQLWAELRATASQQDDEHIE